MLVGHIAVGLAAKSASPRVSAGTLVLAAVLPDLLWCVFLLAGIEHVTLSPGRGAVAYLHAENIAYSHSLLMDAIWGSLLAGAYYLARRDSRGCCILFAAVISHWFLDFISHGPDIPLSPGIAARYGLGLWSSVPATVIVEGGIWLAAIAVYLRSGSLSPNRQGGETRMTFIGKAVFWIGVALLTLAWRGNITGPPPPNIHAMAVGSLIFFSLVVAWAYWMNRLRPTCYNSM